MSTLIHIPHDALADRGGVRLRLDNETQTERCPVPCLSGHRLYVVICESPHSDVQIAQDVMRAGYLVHFCGRAEGWEQDG
jgi:hypothetical protein